MFLSAVETDNALWQLARRADGAVLVRIPSHPAPALALPDAVFAFRVGDPQYAYWEERLREREQGHCQTAAAAFAAAD